MFSSFFASAAPAAPAAPEESASSSAAAPQQSDFSADVTSWLMSYFGQCTKAPETAGDLNFDEEEEKQARKGALCKFKVDPGNLDEKLQKKSGLAYRFSKSEVDKVKGGLGPSPAKFGETIIGVDEGDGWVRVGEYFLPQTRKGISVLTFLSFEEKEEIATDPEKKEEEETAAEPEEPKDKAAEPEEKSELYRPQPWNFRPSVGTWLQAACTIQHSPVGDAEAPSCEGVAVDAVQEQPSGATEAATLQWSQKPSVGTWLQRPCKAIAWPVVQADATAEELIATKAEDPVKQMDETAAQEEEAAITADEKAASVETPEEHVLKEEKEAVEEAPAQKVNEIGEEGVDAIEEEAAEQTEVAKAEDLVKQVDEIEEVANEESSVVQVDKAPEQEEVVVEQDEAVDQSCKQGEVADADDDIIKPAKMDDTVEASEPEGEKPGDEQAEVVKPQAAPSAGGKNRKRNRGKKGKYAEVERARAAEK